MSVRASVRNEDVEIRELTEADDVSDFSCGDDADLDAFLREDAWRLAVEGVARTVVLLHLGGIVAYAALLADAVVLKSPERKRLGLRHDDPGNIPALKIGRLATDARFKFRYRGAGEALMRFAFDQACLISAYAGCRLLTVDAYGTAVGFYERLGFVPNKDPRNARARVLCDACGNALDAAAASATTTISMRLDIAAPTLPAWARSEA